MAFRSSLTTPIAMVARKLPNGMPSKAPVTPSKAASPANNRAIWNRVAPMERSTPISCRRSATLTDNAL